MNSPGQRMAFQHPRRARANRRSRRWTTSPTSWRWVCSNR